jgi:hypothetical protein
MLYYPKINKLIAKVNHNEDKFIDISVVYSHLNKTKPLPIHIGIQPNLN